MLRNIRHASETDMPDCEMFHVIQTLKSLLSDKKCLIGLNECQAALIKLDQVGVTTLHIQLYSIKYKHLGVRFTKLRTQIISVNICVRKSCSQKRVSLNSVN